MVSPHPKNRPVPNRGSPVEKHPKSHNSGRKLQHTPTNAKTRPQKCLFPTPSTARPVPQSVPRPQRGPRLAERAHSLPCSPAGPQQMAAMRHALTPSPKGTLYASSKCYEPPTPECLPIPPSTWMPTPSKFTNTQMVSLNGFEGVCWCKRIPSDYFCGKIKNYRIKTFPWLTKLLHESYSYKNLLHHWNTLTYENAFSSLW